MNENEGLNLLGFNQIYDPAYKVSDATNDDIPILTATSKNTIKTQTEVISKKETLKELSHTLHQPTSMDAFTQAMKSSGTTLIKCTFNYM